MFYLHSDSFLDTLIVFLNYISISCRQTRLSRYVVEVVGKYEEIVY